MSGGPIGEAALASVTAHEGDHVMASPMLCNSLCWIELRRKSGGEGGIRLPPSSASADEHYTSVIIAGVCAGYKRTDSPGPYLAFRTTLTPDYLPGILCGQLRDGRPIQHLATVGQQGQEPVINQAGQWHGHTLP